MRGSDDFDPLEILKQLARDRKTPAETRLQAALILLRKRDERGANLLLIGRH